MKKFIFIIIAVMMFSFISVKATDIANKSASANYLDPSALVIDGNNRFKTDKITILPTNSKFIIIAEKSFFGTAMTNEDFEFITNSDMSMREYCIVWENEYKPTLIYGIFETTGTDSIFITAESFNIQATTNIENARKALGIYKYEGSATDYIDNNYRGYVDYIDSTQYTKYDSTSQYYLISSAENPFSLDDIKKMLYIKDNLVTTFSSNMEVISDTYSSNKNKIGTYSITLEGSDSVGNKTTIILNVVVADTLGPSVTKKVEHIQVRLSDCNFSIFDTVFTSAFDVADDNSYTYELADDIAKENLYVIGTHTWSYSVKDIYDNTTVSSISVEIIDDISPEFYMDKFILNHPGYTLMSDEEIVQHIKNYLKAEGVVATSITILDNEYKDNLDKEGLYEVKYSYTSNNTLVIDSLSLNVYSGDDLNLEVIDANDAAKDYIYIAASSAVLLILIGIIIYKVKKQRKNMI